MRLYREGLRPGTVVDFGFGAFPYVSVSVGITEYPFDVWYRLPRDWAARSGNVTARYVHDAGGHFAAYEVPHLLLGDIWSFFGSDDHSNMGVFRRK